MEEAVRIPLLAAAAVETVGPALHDSPACTVHRARVAGSGFARALALKRIKISNHVAFERFEREREVLQRCTHPCIVRPVFVVQDAPCYGLVLPLADRGSLSDVLHRSGTASLPRALALCLCFDLASALEYIHANLGLLHRDVKPANAVLEDTGRAVLIDFDRACPIGEVPGQNRRRGPSGGRHKDYMVGTLVYMAPELLRRTMWGTASDIYSLAITINEVMTGCVPFSDVRQTCEELHTVLEANYNELTLTSAICSEGLRPNIVGPAAEDPGTAAAIARIQQAIQRGWSDEVGNRLSAEEMRLALQQAAADAHADASDAGARCKLLCQYDSLPSSPAVEQGDTGAVAGGTDEGRESGAGAGFGGKSSSLGLSEAAAAFRAAYPDVIGAR